MTTVQPEEAAQVRYRMVMAPRYRPEEEEAEAHLIGMLVEMRSLFGR